LSEASLTEFGVGSMCQHARLTIWTNGKRATLAFAVVANDKDFVHECLMHIAEIVETDGRVIVENVSVEVW
jgi:hypothetical protein